MGKTTASDMVIKSLALLLAVRCQQKEAVKQLLANFYHQMTAKEAKTFMNRSIMLLEPKERDWLRNLYWLTPWTFRTLPESWPYFSLVLPITKP